MVSRTSSWLYLALVLLAAVTLAYEVRYSFDILRGEEIDSPLIVMKTASNQVDFADPTAVRDGVHAGDRVLSVNGRTFAGTGMLSRAIAQAQPGGAPVRIRVQSAGDSPNQEHSISLAVMKTNSGYLAIAGDLILQFVLPAVCILLGFSVAFLRPRDPLAWLLLAVMLSFPHLLESYKVQSWAPGWSEAGMLYHAGLDSIFPIAIFLFGEFFPERFAPESWARRAWKWQRWVLVLPFAALALIGTMVRVVELNHYQGAAASTIWMRPLNTVALILPFWLISTFFAAMVIKSSNSESMDARRRIRIVYWGATAAFTPALLVTLYSLFRHKSPSDVLPAWAVILIFIPLLIFPLALAYVIVVHKAMGVSVAVRQGLQYALATNGVRAIQAIALLALTIAALKTFADPRHTLVVKGIVALVGIFAVLRIRKLTDYLRVWLDRKFFREAYNAEFVLTELSEQVRSIVETDSLLATVADRIAETLHVSQIAILLRGTGPYQLAYARGYQSSPETAFLATSRTVEVLRDGSEPARVYLDDFDSWLYREDKITDEERAELRTLQTELLLPLQVRKNLLGFVSLGQKKSEEPYTGTDLRLLKSVAGQTGLALENAHLIEEVAREVAQRERLNREVEIAREVQERLFPQSLPEIRGLDYAGYCRPALGVGGDYYDFLSLSSGRLGIAIGDVSGKGIAAALMMASLQASLRGEAARSPEDLSATIANVNRQIYEVSSANRYATFFYGQYDPETHRLQYVNAGHNAPMIFRRGHNAAVDRLQIGGAVVGLLPDFLYEQGSVQLMPGDVLVAFTDGISEAMNKEDEEWEEERLTDAVLQSLNGSAREIIAELFDEADSFVSGAKQHDDMTLVIVRVIT